MRSLVQIASRNVFVIENTSRVSVQIVASVSEWAEVQIVATQNIVSVLFTAQIVTHMCICFRNLHLWTFR